jgi:hypothetical protein
MHSHNVLSRLRAKTGDFSEKYRPESFFAIAAFFA